MSVDSQQRTQTVPAGKPSQLNRIWWLLGILLILAMTAAMQRDWLARIPNVFARRAMALRQHDDVQQWLDVAQRISPNCAETEFLRGRLFRRLGRMDDAKRRLRRAKYLGYSPEAIERENWLASAQSGQMNQVGPRLIDLLNDPRGDEAEICEAFVTGYLRLHQFTSAEPLIEAWLKDQPKDPQPYYWRGLMNRELYYQGRIDEARCEADLNKALALQPNHHRAAFALGEMLADKLKMEDAARLFQIARQHEDMFIEASVAYGRCLRNLNQATKARLVLSEVLERDPTCEEGAFELASLDVEDGDYESALKHIGPALSRNYHDKDLRYVMGVALRGTGKTDEAKVHLEYAQKASQELSRARDLTMTISAEPANANLRYDIGSRFLQYGSTRRGLIWLESALDCDPNHIPTHQILAEFYRQKGIQDPDFLELAQQHAAFTTQQDPSKKPDLSGK